MSANLPRWYLAYFVLAAFDVFTVTGGLYLSHTIVSVFSSSVQNNQIWATNLAEIEELRRLAGEVNAPGNDVFDSRDVPTELARLQRAKAAFDEQRSKIEKIFKQQNIGDNFLDELVAVDSAISLMIGESNKIFGFFQSDQPTLAGARMATMDREYASVNAAIASLNKQIQAAQLAALSSEIVLATELQRYEYLVAAFIVCMILGASLYGYKIHQQMVSSSLERERMLEELMAAKEMAEAAAKAKSDFLTMMSHEIRTPMNGIVGIAELLQLSTLNPQQHQHVATIQSSAQALSSIINDVLDFAKIEAGKMSIQTTDFDLLEVFEDTLSALAPAAHKKGIELLCKVEPSLPEHLSGDPYRLRQVLTNLIGNAVKFTEVGCVQLCASVIEQTPDMVNLRFEVIDTGIGISAQEQQLLFSAFTQTSNVNIRKHGGTGLGLAICKRIVEAYNGEIGVKSEAGQGSTFWFSMRFMRRFAQPDEMPAVRRVLIIDDNKINRQILQEQLSGWQIPCESSESGADGLARLQEAEQGGAPFSLVLLDYHMPGMNGAEVAKKIRGQQDVFGAVKIMLLSSLDYGGDARRDLFDHSLTKPVTKRALLKSLLSLFNPNAMPSVGSGPIEASSKRLLLVEDNPVNQMVVVGMLNSLGYQVDVAQNGQEGIAARQKGRYDLILMDCQMPVMDGYSATRQIRRIESERIPIVALTAHAVEGARAQAIDAGMDDYLAKPVTIAALREMLSRWLSKGEAAHSAEGEGLLEDGADISPKVMALFSRLGPPQVEEILQAATDGERAEAAHKLKGSALSIGLPLLAERCAEIERRSRTGGDTRELLLGLRELFDHTLAALTQRR